MKGFLFSFFFEFIFSIFNVFFWCFCAPLELSSFQGLFAMFCFLGATFMMLCMLFFLHCEATPSSLSFFYLFWWLAFIFILFLNIHFLVVLYGFCLLLLIFCWFCEVFMLLHFRHMFSALWPNLFFSIIYFLLVRSTSFFLIFATIVVHLLCVGCPRVFCFFLYQRLVTSTFVFSFVT
jgi:hypothetical protein